MLTQPAHARPLCGEVAGCNLPGIWAGQPTSSATAMPDARPLSATSQWWSDSAAMFMAQDLRQCDGLSTAGQAKRLAVS